jgi:hypothetical protein
MKYILFSALLLISCNSDLVIPDFIEQHYCRLSINVEPDSLTRTVTLSDHTTSEEFIIDSGVSELIIDTVFWGLYTITARAEGHGTESTHVGLSSRNQIFLGFKLNPFPNPLEDWRPQSDEFNQRQFFFWVKTVFSEEQIKNLIATTPSMDFTVEEIETDTRRNRQRISIAFHPSDLYRSDSFAIHFNDTTESFFHSTFEFPFTLHYEIDSTQRNSRLLDYYTQSHYPRIWDFLPTTETNIVPSLTFHQAILPETLQKAIHIDPPHAGIWEVDQEDQNKIVFVSGDFFQAATDYRIHIDTSLVFADSTSVREGFYYRFFTRDLRLIQNRSHPRQGSTTVDQQQPFHLVFSSSMDSLSLIEGIDITPSLDPLSFSFSNTKDSVTIEHAPLESNVTYRLCLDSAVTDRKGTSLRADTLVFSNE